MQAQKIVEVVRGRREQRMMLFRILMANRRARNASSNYVEALNLIEIFFDDHKDKDVRDAWAVYFDFLNEKTSKDWSPERWKQNEDRATDLLVALLAKMGARLGYKFNAVQLAKGAYWPQGHLDDMVDRNIIRSSLARILAGRPDIPMAVTSFPVDPAAAEKTGAVQDALLDVFSGKAPLKVERAQ